MPPNPPLDPRTAGWNAEYLFRRVFHVTHEQYLDTPNDEIEWLLRIHQKYVEQEARDNQG